MKNKILELLATTRHPYEVADRLSLKVSEVRKVMKNEYLERIPGWGRVSIQPHIISRRHAYMPGWPIRDHHVLQEHKRLHDQGKVTMCQGRDGDYIIQYAIPSVTRIKRMPYFYGG